MSSQSLKLPVPKLEGGGSKSSLCVLLGMTGVIAVSLMSFKHLKSLDTHLLSAPPLEIEGWSIFKALFTLGDLELRKNVQSVFEGHLCFNGTPNVVLFFCNSHAFINHTKLVTQKGAVASLGR